MPGGVCYCMLRDEDKIQSDRTSTTVHLFYHEYHSGTEIVHDQEI